MNVLVNGIGNIGSTLIGILNKYQTELGISKIYALKNQLLPWQVDDIEYLKKIGIEIISTDGSHSESIDSVKNDIHYIFDTTNNGGGLNNKNFYETFPSLIGASAQGSEKNFGVSFMTGVNNQVVSQEKYAHIVSCNTHSLASLLHTFSGHSLDNLSSADFVVVRRSEDLGNHQRLVSANVVARHLDPTLGTHHSIDVVDLYKTRKLRLDVTSSDVTTPSQLMHGVRFNIKLKKSVNHDDLRILIENNPLISTSVKFDSNVIFERGRRLSYQGRIYSHAIIIENNIIVNKDRIMGWAFIPQEGNTLLSTIHAFLLQTKNKKESQLMQLLSDNLLFKRW